MFFLKKLFVFFWLIDPPQKNPKMPILGPENDLEHRPSASVAKMGDDRGTSWAHLALVDVCLSNRGVPGSSGEGIQGSFMVIMLFSFSTQTRGRTPLFPGGKLLLKRSELSDTPLDGDRIGVRTRDRNGYS